MTMRDVAGDLAAEFRALNEHLHAAGDRAAAMQRLVDLASEWLPGCAWAATTVWPVDRPPHSSTVSGEVARIVDQLQYDLGDGPCLDAARTGEAVRIADLSAEDRWPAFCRQALSDTPVRGILSYPLLDGDQRIVLNLYADRPDAFDKEAFNTGTLFAAHAAVLAAHADIASKAANLTQALSTSRQIGAAIGILMSAYTITDEQAFELLRTTSQNLNRKLRDVARDVTDTGELPARR
ncbi:transcriptional regulator [Actinocatenispora thailandica]|uniref:Transcriptional regulator n=1 Tax=Actinocatenispora thailandica TaxID=227318 RepID=A0A7R7DM99_9ACTN|nr:GAF and ANTAR domain-containing protein [Actinocatenispora thailandica]BCJ34111.1 transcriptional regulator [Actinocatenispora thailandica]